MPARITLEMIPDSQYNILPFKSLHSDIHFTETAATRNLIKLSPMRVHCERSYGNRARLNFYFTLYHILSYYILLLLYYYFTFRAQLWE